MWTIRTPSNTGTLTWDVDGGAPTGSLLQTGANALITTTISPTLGTHTLNLTNPASAATAYFSAIVCYNSAVPAVDVINAGCATLTVGTSSTGLARSDTPYASASAITYIAPDLTIICCTINDANAATSPTTYAASMQSVITNCKLSGDVILLAGFESNFNAFPANNRALLLAQLQALAATNNCLYVTPDIVIGGWTSNDALGLMYDNFHPTANGYQRLADMVAGLL